jgi:predicted permease
MLTESVVLALVGGAVGVLVATLAVPLLAHLVPTSLPLGERPRLDVRALLIAGAFTTLIGIGFGLFPATTVGGRAGFNALREGTRGGGGRRQRLRTVLVTVEIALSVVLLVSSGFLIRAVWKVQAVDPGFTSEGVLTLRTALASSRYADSLRRTEFYRQVLSEVRRLPGVEAAAYTSGVPMVLTGGIAGVEIPGREVNRGRSGETASFRLVTPHFFQTLGIPIVRGRDIEEADLPGRLPAAVVSESFAKRYWPNDDPIGKVFRARGQDRTIVGIARDIMVRGLERTSEPQMYLAAAQAPTVMGELYVPKDLVIRTSGPVSALVAPVREIVRRVDPEQPISEVRSLNDIIVRQTADRVAQLWVLTALAAIALLLTGVGIYGLLAFMVAQRSREIGVRLALGAEPGRVARMIVGEAARLTLLGGIPGVLVAYAAARAMSALLFGIAPSDPMTLATGAFLVVLVTIAGALAPAVSAVRVSPLIAMRTE